jgi:hypothetical protein
MLVSILAPPLVPNIFADSAAFNSLEPVVDWNITGFGSIFKMFLYLS